MEGNAAFRQSSLAAEETAIRWGPLNGGPLSDAVTSTFRGGSYTESVLSGETTLYRSYGGNALHTPTIARGMPRNLTLA